jgi:hypothetical protein
MNLHSLGSTTHAPHTTTEKASRGCFEACRNRALGLIVVHRARCLPANVGLERKPYIRYQPSTELHRVDVTLWVSRVLAFVAFFRMRLRGIISFSAVLCFVTPA